MGTHDDHGDTRFERGSHRGGKGRRSRVEGLHRRLGYWWTHRKHLGSAAHHTVYEGEGIGLNLAVGLLRAQQNVEGNVSVFVDNTAAIMATHNTTSAPSHYIWDALHEALEQLHETHPRARVTFKWAPGHKDIQGNEAADEEAKKAADPGTQSDGDAYLRRPLRGTLPRSKSATIQDFHEGLRTRTQNEWVTSPRYPRLRALLPKPLAGLWLKHIAALPKTHASIMIRLRTGHLPLARHLHTIKRADSPVCPCCHREDESVRHYLLHCPAHANARGNLIRRAGRHAQDLEKLLSRPDLTRHLLRFVAQTGRFRAIFGEIEDLPEPTPQRKRPNPRPAPTRTRCTTRQATRRQA
ncbi:unnamed protein product [Mycena citricolor]|uniref:RNase H type-1 domain-containing protein n=1 Tax=Mycena citricolor TaxID=2018698 RepID=A0AAD2Q3I6_9AGAR|nr:unnamed protein product [Mycena citricolor]